MEKKLNEPKKIGFLSIEDPLDKRSWSGTFYQLYKNIEDCGFEVVWIPANQDAKIVSFINKGMRFLCRKFKKKYSGAHLSSISRQIAKSIDQKQLAQVDFLFIPAAAKIPAFLNTDKPMIYLNDSTFKLLYNYYMNYTNFFWFNLRQGNIIEKRTAQKAWRIIVSSDWAKESFVNDYQVAAEKIKVMEFGSNIDNVEVNPNVNYLQTNQLNLLFLGVEWERKGGDVAVECVDYLNQQGIKAILNVVGVDVPDQYKNNPNVKNIGFLNKNKEEEYSRLKQIIYHSDLLLLPTKAECSAIVFSEASAYGLPIFTYNTGGIPNYVVDGKNGFALPLSSRGNNFGQKIIDIIKNNQLSELKSGAIAMYNEKLNWGHWQSEFRSMIDEYKAKQIN